eukprot:gene9463-10450_t
MTSTRSCTPPQDEDIASDEELEPTEDEAQERIDEVKDRVYDHDMIGRTIREFYDEWHFF